MRIAMIGQKGVFASTSGGGGIERHVEELSRRLSVMGNEVIAYSRPWYGSGSAFSGRMSKKLHIVNLPSMHTKHLDAISHTFIATLHALFSRPDVFHYHGVGPSLLAWIPRIFTPRKKVIVTFHSIDRVHEKWGRFARFMLTLGEWTACHFAHVTIVPSRSVQEYCKKKYGIETAHIPYGIYDDCKSAEKTNIAETLNNIIQNQDYILAVTRLVPHKGVHHLIEAYQNVSALFTADNKLIPKLIIAGDGSFTDEYVATLHEFAAPNPNIVFAGYQGGKTLHELYANARLFIHPSLSEGLPHVVLEAAMHGTPALVSDIPESREAVGDHGYIFKAGDVTDLTNKLTALLTKDVKILKAQGSKLRLFAKRQYNWDHLAKKIERVYARAACI